MPRLILAALLSAAVTTGATAAWAQTDPNATPGTPSQTDTSAPSSAAEPPAAAGKDQPAAAPEGGPASPITNNGHTVDNPHLQVASVKLENGYRAGKVIGATVYNAQNQQVGTVSDIVLDQNNTATLVVVSVGGVLGVGGKLVALPYGDLQRGDGKVIIANADKKTLMDMPSFTY